MNIVKIIFSILYAFVIVVGFVLGIINVVALIKGVDMIFPLPTIILLLISTRIEFFTIEWH